jgi:hypothetical protein
MQLSGLASLIKVIFASSGTKNTIPDNHSSVPTPANAANDTGFPSITMTPVSAGGIPPFGADMNGVLFALANALQSLQSGAVYAYDSTFSAAIGGYAKGALLLKATGAGYWVSTADNNATNPDSGGANWVDLAAFLSALGKYVDVLPTGSANVMTSSITLPTLNAAFAGAPVYVRAIGANTIANPTYAGKTIVKGAGAALISGDIAGAGHWLTLEYDATFDQWVLANPAFGVSSNQPHQLQSLTVTQASNALTATLAANVLDYRNPTLASGAPVTQANAALTFNLPATSNLGMVLTGQVNRIVFLTAYNGGTPVACAVNIAGGVSLDETGLISPTTVGASSNSAGVIYSQSAVAANSPYRVTGFADVVFTTGTGWSTPTVVQPVGGQALAALSSLGYGQVWQVVTRTSGTTYYNTTGKPIAINGNISSSGSAVGSITATVDGVMLGLGAGGNSSQAGSGSGFVIVPPGKSYLITISNAASTAFYELR